MSARGFITGSLALIVLETLVQDGASTKAGGLVAKTAELIHHVLSPATPGLHWYAGQGTAAGGDEAAPSLSTPASPSAVAVVLKPGPQNRTVDQFVNLGAIPSYST